MSPADDIPALEVHQVTAEIVHFMATTMDLANASVDCISRLRAVVLWPHPTQVELQVPSRRLLRMQQWVLWL